MSSNYILYAVPGWGSVLTEAMFTWCGAPFRLEDVSGFDREGPSRDKLKTINPLAQVPTLVLPNGMTMTESAAIALYLAELYPEAELAPPLDSPQRAPYLRYLIWLVANVYPTFTYGDYPARWVTASPESLTASTNAYRENLWRSLESELGSGLWALGDRFSALDIYIAVMTRWRPRRTWFDEHCPKLAGIARRADNEPRLRAVWERNFPAQP
jgi:GST-like protein